MNILFLCHKTPYPPNDGGAIATLNMIRGFEKLGDQVTVLCMQTPKHAFSISNLPKHLKAKISWYQVFVNTKIKPLDFIANLFFSNKPYNAARFESKTFDDKLKNLLHSNSFDVVQLEGAYLQSYVKTIRTLSNAKISLRAHNVEYEIWDRLAENESLLLKKKYYKLLAKRVKSLENNLLKVIDFLVPITTRDEEVLCKDRVLLSHVSPTGMDDDMFHTSIPKNAKTIFYIGALDWLPNQEALKWFISKVWSEVCIDAPDWDFVIAGRNAPESFVNYLNSQSIRFLGEVERASDFIDDHNIMVVPLQSGSGMRIKIIEGMARGKCILTTSVGAEGILAKNGDEIFIQNEVEQTIQVLSQLMQNPKEIERCAKNAFIFVQQNYNNHIIIKELRSFYAKHLSIS